MSASPSPSDAPSSPPSASSSADLTSAEGARYALFVLAFINLFHFLDRYVLMAVLPRIQKDLTLSDKEAGILGAAFMVVFMTAAPVFGLLGDRYARTRLIAAGVAVWSAATALAGLARSYLQLLGTRTLVGVGEAAYATISPSIIADLFPPASRARAMSVYFAAMPAGAALGFILGGAIEARWGWRAAFLVAGLPGLVLALLNLTIREPERGRFVPSDAAPPPSTGDALRTLGACRRYLGLVAGYTAYCFAVGGLAFWMPTFLHRVRGMELARANTIFGAVTVVGGIVGAIAGGVIADRLLRTRPRAHALVAGVSTLAAAPLLALSLWVEHPVALFGTLLAAEIFLFASQGPVNTAIVDAVPGTVRASAVATSIFVQHLLGDAISPTIIGAVSDAVRDGAAPGTPLALASGRGLQMGVLIVPAVLLVGGVIWGWLGREEGGRPSAA